MSKVLEFHERLIYVHPRAEVFFEFHTRIISDFILSIIGFLVGSLFESKEIIYDPFMITKNHSPVFHTSFTFLCFFIFFGKASLMWFCGITMLSTKKPQHTISVVSR